jgi:hypothetical protein
MSKAAGRGAPVMDYQAPCGETNTGLDLVVNLFKRTQTSSVIT